MTDVNMSDIYRDWQGQIHCLVTIILSSINWVTPVDIHVYVSDGIMMTGKMSPFQGIVRSEMQYGSFPAGMWRRSPFVIDRNIWWAPMIVTMQLPEPLCLSCLTCCLSQCMLHLTLRLTFINEVSFIISCLFNRGPCIAGVILIAFENSRTYVVR